MSIFDVRKEYKPSEYPKADDLRMILTNTFWSHNELTFEGDKADIHNLEPWEQEIIKRTLTLIATVEVKVKDFWGQLGDHFPKPEFKNLGTTASESEVRHSESYDKLLNVLNLYPFYSEALKVEAIQGRFNYLDKYLKLSPHNSDKKKYLLKLILFSVLVENVSLFSQFATIVYFFRHKGVMKDIKNVVSWTAIDEQTHFRIGQYIVQVLREEFPEMFDEELEAEVKRACAKSIKHESVLLDWVFEQGELPYMPKKDIEQYMMARTDESLVDLGFTKHFNVSEPKSLQFFNDEVFAESMDDFFAMRPTDYTLRDIPINADTIFAHE